MLAGSPPQRQAPIITLAFLTRDRQVSRHAFESAGGEVTEGRRAGGGDVSPADWRKEGTAVAGEVDFGSGRGAVVVVAGRGHLAEVGDSGRRNAEGNGGGEGEDEGEEGGQEEVEDGEGFHFWAARWGG